MKAGKLSYFWGPYKRSLQESEINDSYTCKLHLWKF